MRAEERVQYSVFKRLVNGDLSVENAVIKYKNFSGAPTNVNPAGGKRTFVLLLNEEIAEDLRMEGWNVKYKEPLEEGGYPSIYTEINVNMESTYPPKVVLITEKNGKQKPTNLKGDMVKSLDRARLENIDMIIHPYEHGRPGQYKVKGYARAIYATQAEDTYFDGKYSNLDDYEEEDNFNYNEEAF